MGKHRPTQWWWDDWSRDTRCLSTLAAGGWIRILEHLDGVPVYGRDTLTYPQWAAVMGCSVAQARAIIAELARWNVAVVTTRLRFACAKNAQKCAKMRNVKRTGNAFVTIVCRRMDRRRKELEALSLRVKKHRSRSKAQIVKRNCNGRVKSLTQHTQHTQRTQRIRTHPTSQLLSETETALGTAGARDPKLGTVGGQNNREAIEKTQKALGDFPNNDQFAMTAVMQACGFDLATARKLCRSREPKYVRQKIRWALDHVRPDGNLAGLVRSLLEKPKGAKR